MPVPCRRHVTWEVRRVVRQEINHKAGSQLKPEERRADVASRIMAPKDIPGLTPEPRNVAGYTAKWN